jgi:acyl-CoA synthetase (AMP-forming)/AMP-acid ligase II
VKNSIADGVAAADCIIYFVPPPSAIFTLPACARFTFVDTGGSEQAPEHAAQVVPKQVVFTEALPKSTVGKILRRELRQTV